METTLDDPKVELSHEKLNQLLNDGYKIEQVLRDLVTYTKPNIQSLLVSFLQKYSHSELYFYLPQLVNLSLNYASYNSYSNFLNSLAISDQNFGLRLYWSLLTYINHPSITGINREIMKLENCIVNGKLEDSSSEPIPIYRIEGLEDELLFRKLIRNDYFDQQKSFFENLIKKSEELNQETEFLDVFLTSFLLETNNKLLKLRTKYSSGQEENYTARLYRGIVIPFDNSLKTEQIVRVIPSESLCMKTKTRVPYLIVFETVDLNENSSSVPKELRLVRNNSIELQSKYFVPFDRSSSHEFSLIMVNEPWAEKSQRLRAVSPFGHYQSWKLRGLIVKSNDDLRQECLAMQIITKSLEIFQKESLSIYLRPYEIIVTGNSSGLIEYIPDTKSIHDLKKEHLKLGSLVEIFKKVWGHDFDDFQHNFVLSMAGYSLVTYILNVKDRHNKNLLIDKEGHIIHIDYGFFLTSSPGGNFGFESSPFKLTKEMIRVMGGRKGPMFTYYSMLVYKGFLALRRHYAELELLIDIMQISSDFPCFVDKKYVLKDFRERFFFDLNDSECSERVKTLIEDSSNNWTTNQYDYYQERVNDIIP
jgi:hypothetical protein